MSLILITHDLRLAFSTCDRIYVLYAGSLLEVGDARARSRSDPFHPYTLGLLLSEPPADKRVPRLIAIRGSVPRADEVAGRCTLRRPLRLGDGRMPRREARRWRSSRPAASPPASAAPRSRRRCARCAAPRSSHAGAAAPARAGNAGRSCARAAGEDFRRPPRARRCRR